MVDGTVGAVDNAGGGTKKVDTSELTVSAQTVERQRIVLANNANPSAFATNFPAGFLRITDEPTQLFYDDFDTTLDTTVRWNTPVTGGVATAAVNSIGNMTMGSGTTANNYSTLSTQPTFALSVPAWLGISFAIQIENPVTTNGYRFWGTGTIPGTPTATAPLTDAIGFELYTDGKLYAVVYASGTRTVIQDMSSATGNSTQPSDGLFHRYIVYVRTDKSFWYIDQLDTIAATSNFQSPSVQIQSVRFITIAGSTPPTSSCVITCAGMAVWDTGKNNQTISDGTYGFRKAQVSAAGAIGVDPSIGGPIQGTDGNTQHSVALNTLGEVLIDTDDLVELLTEIRNELRAIRFGMEHLTRQDLRPSQFINHP